MKLNLVHGTIVGVMVVMAACGGGASSQPAPAQPAPAESAPALAPAADPTPTPITTIDGVIAKMRDYANQVCACSDEACFNTVQQDLKQWSDEIAGNAELRSSHPTEQQQAELNTIAKQLGDCAAKLLSKPSTP
ncbi:MAG: hypothetical protein AB7O24_25870 [Kofleriaceae bacterium]